MTDCQLIDGATASTYPHGPGDIGRRYGVGVVATNAGGPSEEEFSDLTAPVQRVPTTAPPPPPVVVPPPPPPPDNSFVTLRKRASADGKLEFRVQARGAGRFSARATANLPA